MCSFGPNLGCAVGVKNVSGFVVLDKQTEQLYNVQPFRNGLPLCNDPAYVVGALRSSCILPLISLPLPLNLYHRYRDVSEAKVSIEHILKW